jgi:hypothetical protein
MLGPDVTADNHARADYSPIKSWARESLAFEVVSERDKVEIICTGEGLEKRIRFSRDGAIEVSWTWDTAGNNEGVHFATEISLFRPLEIEATPSAVKWVAPVETVAKSEKGLDRTIQGEAVTLLWEASLGAAALRIRRSR